MLDRASTGFEAYLVGGCVRDLILRRTPKDFDVITTAQLKQIKKQFHRSYIVGTRFPICLVHVKGSIIEVSSFDTVAKHDGEKKKLPFSKMPSGCSKKDFILWKNCLSRDFTINRYTIDSIFTFCGEGIQKKILRCRKPLDHFLYEPMIAEVEEVTAGGLMLTEANK